jgi:seryl-tRNA(Sec) selenium transferase
VQLSVSPHQAEKRLRDGPRPIVTRIQEDRVAVDLRTVNEQDEPTLLNALLDAAKA